MPGWTGAGYIITDPAIGDGAYKISGGGNGGALFSAITAAIGMLAIMVSLSPFALILAYLAGPAIALAITIFSVWSLVLYEIQQLDSGPARGILANLAYGAFGIAVGALTGSAWIALISWIVFSVANYYISYLDKYRREFLYA